MERRETTTRKFSYIVPNSAVPERGLGPIYRSPLTVGPELSIDGEVLTLYDNFWRSVTLHANSPCLGFRPSPTQEFRFSTYKRCGERAEAFGAGLLKLGLVDPNPEGMRLLGLFSKNRMEWVLAEQGCFCYSVVPVPLYDTFGEDSVGYVIGQTGMTTVVCSQAVSSVLRGLGGKSTLKTVIQMEPVSMAQRRDFESVGITLLYFEEVEKAGYDFPQPHRPPSPTDVATFCYTSGTTGDPKGALETHQGIICNASAVKAMGLDLSPEDAHLSYLPLPHMFERITQASCFAYGAHIGFYQGDPLLILDDLAALRPTFFPSVPRLLNRIHDKLKAGIEEAGGVKQSLFNYAYSTKLANLENGQVTHPVWDRIIFNGIRARVGLDRCRMMLTGSAPIAGHVLDFLRIVFCCPVHEGYGQTEATCASTFTFADDLTVGHVGGPLPCNDVRLVDVPEMGYFHTDKSHGADSEGNGGLPCNGRGEICFRGPNVFRGYYKMPEKTAETIDSEGWLHSGDIGLWLPSGKLKIIDRKKNIFKLSQGEYIAPEKVENIYTQSPFVMQNFVYGDSLQSCLVGVVVPDPEYLLPWAEKKQIPGTLEELCADGRVIAAVLEDMNRYAARAGLKGFEMVKAIVLNAEMFSVDNGILTPTFKLKRSNARDVFRAQIDDMYDSIANKLKSRL